MTDDQSTGSGRDAVPRPAPIVPPQFQAPPRNAPSPYPAPTAYPPPQWTQQAPGWAPPPKPGLIPLAPLGFGTILGAPYRLFRRNPRPTFGMSLLIQGGVTFLTIAVIGLVAWATLSRVSFAGSSDAQDQIVAGSIGLIALSALIPAALSVVATGLMQGIIVLEVSRQTLGEKLTFRGLWQRGRSRVWAVAGYTLAVFGISAVVIALVVGVVIVPFAIGGASAIGIGVLVAVLLGLALVVVWAFLATKLAFVPSAIVLERLSSLNSIARSWALTRNAFWKVFGTILLVAFILGVASNLVQTPFSFIAGIASSLISPTGDMDAALAVFIGCYIVILVLSLVIAAISLVVQSATTALLYIDQRIRKEGLDLDLMRYVDARQAGDPSAIDPFEATPAAYRTFGYPS